MFRPPAPEPLEARIAPAAGVFNLHGLNGANGFKLAGAGAYSDFGSSVSGAGDVNGDGFADFIIGADLALAHGVPAGAAYVVFGKANGFPAALDIATLDGTTGFKLAGEAVKDFAGASVSGGGDINGDGFADLLVGATGASASSGPGTGAAYVIFGHAGAFPARVHLASLHGVSGFKIEGEAGGDVAGISVSGAGDVNGDGFADVLVGAFGADPHGTDSGASYVVFGHAGPFPTALKLASLDGANGFKIQGEAAGDYAGGSVSSAGDVNGDGFADLLIGAEGAIPDGNYAAGASYVVFGQAGGFPAALDLSTLDGTNGFKLKGASKFDFAGSSVSGAGDVNGDGFDDLLIGAFFANDLTGATYVVFGKADGFPAMLDLATLDGTNGFTVRDSSYNFIYSGISVSGAGDFNGDGFDDLLIAAHPQYVGSGNETYAGANFLVFGRAGGFGPSLELTSLNGFNGFQFSGPIVSFDLPSVVSGAGDVNGDGLADVLIGSYAANHNHGGAYVVFGFRPGVKIAPDGRSATVRDGDGDLLTVTTDLGKFAATDFQLGPNGGLARLDLAHRGAEFSGANLRITATKHGSGDGLANVGAIDAHGLDLGSINLSGNLGQITAGDVNPQTPAIQMLDVGSLGGVDPLRSELAGSLGALLVHGDVQNAALLVAGKIGQIAIGGDLVSTDPTQPVTISALGKFGALHPRAIASLAVHGSVENALILAGYDAALAPVNPAAGIGKILVGGDWRASSVAAGVADATHDGFGRNDTLIPGGSVDVIAKIASITIRGTATGSAASGDFFGITAGTIRRATLNGTTFVLSTGQLDFALDATNADFHLVTLA